MIVTNLIIRTWKNITCVYFSFPIFAVLNTLFVSSDAQIRPGQNIAHWCFSFCFPLPLRWPVPLCCFLYFERSPQPRKTTGLIKMRQAATCRPLSPTSLAVLSTPPPPTHRRSPGISFNRTDSVFRKSIALTKLQFWTESRMKPRRTISGWRVGSRFSINLAKIVVFRAGSALGDSDPSGCLTLKDSRHGHLYQNHIFSVYFPVNIVK